MQWIIGDIHGMLKCLESLLEAILKQDADAHFIFVGDYINRGPESSAVVTRLMSLNNAVFLRGNHDDIFDMILRGQSYLGNEQFDALSGFLGFMNHGLAETLTSYGADYAELEFLLHHPSLERLAQVVSVVPENHRRFFQSLLPVVEFEDFFVAHAFWHPDVPDKNPDLISRLGVDATLRHQTLWGRYTEAQIQQVKYWERTGYFGHTPVSNYRRNMPPLPIQGHQIVLLDTGAALGVGGRLTAVCPSTRETVQVDRAGKVLPRKKPV